MHKFRILTKLILITWSFFFTVTYTSAQCNDSDFQVLKSIYDNINISVWNNNAGWSIFAVNSTCPSGFDMETLHGVTLNTNDRVVALNLSNNNLIGTLPNQFDGLEELRALNLSKNKLSGTIPASIGDITTLEVLQLQKNNLNSTLGFTGSIPFTGSNFQSLKTLRLNKNSLTGGIPDNIGQIVTLEEIGLHNNSLGGVLPASIGNLTSLTNLKLFNNNIEGCFPSTYADLCSQLTNVNIDNGNSLDTTWAAYCDFRLGACDKPFITTWKTDNLGINTPCTTCVEIPTIGAGYSYDVDWDMDGSYDELNVTGNTIHDYGTAGTYQVAIRGTFPRIFFQDSPENNKILSVDQWGDIKWLSMEGAFSRCSNLNILAADNPNIGQAVSMSGMFSHATSMNEDLSSWEVGTIRDMSGLFFSATSFNQNLSAWDIFSVTDMTDMLDNTALSENNYDQTLIGWSGQDVEADVELGANGLAYCSSEQLRASLINSHNWKITGDENCISFDPFISTWKTDNPGVICDNCITLPTEGSGYNYDIDWNNDGTFDIFGITGNAILIYDSPGEYTINIKGDFPRIYFNNSGDKEKIITVDQWGDIEWASMASAFYGCSNLQLKAMDVPNLQGVTDMSNMFKSASSLDQNLSNWNVTTVTTMSGMFDGATSFNSLLYWENKTANVTDMSSMFEDAVSFNKDLSEWNVSAVTDMSSMFKKANMFNQDITTWPVLSVTDMSSMFRGALAFDQDLSAWDVSAVTDMNNMFNGAIKFDSSLNWGDKTANVTDMNNMFYRAERFNQNLSGWDVSAVIDMNSMFQEATNFNGSLNWGDKTANVTSTGAMFKSTAFNQDISGWDVSSITAMNSMFENAAAFNQNLSGWVVSSVETMKNMFKNAIVFDQDLSNWDISNVSTMENMFDLSGLNVFNFDQILIGWGAQQVQSDVFFGASGLIYCLGADYRSTLINSHSWTFTGDFQDSGLNSANSSNEHWSSKELWSLGRPPSLCNDVVIDNSDFVRLTNSKTGYGQSLEIAIGTILKIESGAQLEIGTSLISN